MLADTPWPRGFGAALASVDTFFQGLQNSSLPPRSALQATCDGTHGLIEFLLSRQSFSAALQVALRVADQPSTMLGPRSGLQRLTQSLFQVPAIGAADSRSRTVFQDHFKFAMGDGLQAQNAFDIDNSRTRDADKTDGIEPLGKLVQRGPVQQFLSSDVQVRINAGSFDPVDIGHPYEAR